MLSVSLCIKFWFVHLIPKSLNYVIIFKGFIIIFMCDFVLHFADSVVSAEKQLQAGWFRVQITERA
jgi:hypothetical protein